MKTKTFTRVTTDTYNRARETATGPEATPAKLRAGLDVLKALQFQATIHADDPLFVRIQPAIELLLRDLEEQIAEEQPLADTAQAWTNLFYRNVNMKDPQTSHEFFGRFAEWARKRRRPSE